MRMHNPPHPGEIIKVFALSHSASPLRTPQQLWE
jgi:plasmid maintenance system antidote protein VapI